jgi:hypothetical protein
MMLDEIFESLKIDEDEMVYTSFGIFFYQTAKTRIYSTTGIIQFGCDYQASRTFESG